MKVDPEYINTRVTINHSTVFGFYLFESAAAKETGRPIRSALLKPKGNMLFKQRLEIGTLFSLLAIVFSGKCKLETTTMYLYCYMHRR